ncbi:MAG: hypothetical protein WC538_19815 [Thermoanaerobaculia bacterium]|jgi:hypothetical protein
MKTFERVLFLVAFLFIDIYVTGHIYHLWLEPKSSVMDEFKDEAEGAISSATDIQQLLSRYRPIHEAVKAAEKQNAGKPPEEWRFEEEEPFKSEATLRQGIQEWEERRKELFETRVYWCFGLITALVGLALHAKVSRWLGLAFLATGFSELIWWCSPSWISRATAESDRLLANKLALAAATAVLLVAVARALGILKNESFGNVAEAPPN